MPVAVFGSGEPEEGSVRATMSRCDVSISGRETQRAVWGTDGVSTFALPSHHICSIRYGVTAVVKAQR